MGRGASRHRFSSVDYRLYASSSRLAMAERGMNTTPEKGHLFLRGP